MPRHVPALRAIGSSVPTLAAGNWLAPQPQRFIITLASEISITASNGPRCSYEILDALICFSRQAKIRHSRAATHVNDRARPWECADMTTRLRRRQPPCRSRLLDRANPPCPDTNLDQTTSACSDRCQASPYARQKGSSFADMLVDIHSSGTPALRRPAKYVVSTNLRILGTPQESTVLKRAMLE
jgi:hypothetical protein